MTGDAFSPSRGFEQPGRYRKTTLQNGVRIVTEEVPYLYSLSVGILVRSGSRYEDPALNGVCHFVEHMLFKGTKTRSAIDIAREIDSVGGALNAFTSKEMTSYYAKVMAADTELAVDLLTDIFLNSSFPEAEIEREKGVICQEILQTEDNPEDFIHEILGIRFWADDALGQPILGTIPTVMNFNRDTLLRFKNDAYSPSETIVCAAGLLDHDEFVNLIAARMGSTPSGRSQTAPEPPKAAHSSFVMERDLEQIHICVGLEAPSAVDERRFEVYLLNSVLGGGMSSRLFQEIRENRGLAYSIYSFLNCFSDTGMLGIYAACEPARVNELVSVMWDETERLKATVTEADLKMVKNQLKGNIILAMESSDARMNRLAKGEFFFGRRITLDEIMASIDAVTLDDLVETAERLLNSGRVTSVGLGPSANHPDLFKPITG